MGIRIYRLIGSTDPYRFWDFKGLREAKKAAKMKEMVDYSIFRITFDDAGNSMKVEVLM